MIVCYNLITIKREAGFSMMQKEYINIEICMRDMYARREKDLKECLEACAAYAGLCLLYTVTVGFILFVIAEIPYAWIGYLILALPWFFPVRSFIGYVRYRKESELRLQEIHPTVIRTSLSSKQEKELVKHDSRYIKVRRSLSSYFEADAREYQMGYWYEWYLLYFPEGRYSVHLDNFVWSKEHTMPGKGLFRYAEPGDEFYLLIAGYGEPEQEILIACPAKLFRWEETELTQTDENT